jgi:hypothetical protein
MKFKAGDKVKFLNDVGGGIIKKIISPTMVSVMVEDGFEIPVMINEILLAESSDVKEAMFNQSFSLSATSQELSKEDMFMDRVSALQKFSSLNAKSNGIYLAYIPQDQVWLLKDNIDLFVVNHSPFEILYSFILAHENRFEGIDYGSVPPFSKIHIQTIQRDDLERWLNGFVQILFFKENDTTVRIPLHTPFNIKLIRFLQKDAYAASNFMEEKGVLVYLGQALSAENFPQIERQKNDNSRQNTSLKPADIITEKKIIDKYKVDKNTAEVDLHIESMVEDHSKMDKSQILETQRRLFIQCLESAIEEKLQKIIFIHGVGNGILKNEITTILKQYPNIHYFDASMQKYGCGATEVLIRS